MHFGRTRDIVIGYVDSNFSRDLDKRRSLIGYVYTCGSCVVSWKATLHTTIALWTIEVEYITITEACNEDIWLRGLLGEICGDLQTTIVFYDG